jgi:AcrR family transcriptional regulator
MARHQHDRIVYATASVAAEKGYAAATIADITTTAGVDRRVFYAHFRDKQHAFLAAHELGFQQTIAVCASAFFSSEYWPDRIWEGLHAGTQFDASHPVVAHIGYVEAHAVGNPAIQRVDDSRAAFNIFVQEGYRHTSKPPPPAALDAISATIFEIGYRYARTRQLELLPRMTPNAAYLVLAPFLGPQQADAFIDAKLSEHRLTQTAFRQAGGEGVHRNVQGSSVATSTTVAVDA